MDGLIRFPSLPPAPRRPRHRRRLLLCSLLALASLAADASAGELSINNARFPRFGSVGMSIRPSFTLVNLNSQYSLGACFTRVLICLGPTVVYNDSMMSEPVGPGESKVVDYTRTWTPQTAGTYVVTVAANSPANISGPQTSVFNLSISAVVDCPERPTLLSGEILYLGGAGSGAIRYSTPDPACCYQIRPHIVSGHDAMTIDGGSTWRFVPSTGIPITVTVPDAAKAAGKTLLVRVDWRKCDGSARGSDYVMVSPGAQPPAGLTGVTPPTVVSTGATPGAELASDPVNTATGELVHRETADIRTSVSRETVPEFRRSYASFLTLAGTPTHDLGTNWSHNYAWRMMRAETEAYIFSPSGERFRFATSGASYILDYPRTAEYRLTRRGDRFHFLDGARQRVWQFDLLGRPIAVKDRRGDSVALEYDDGRLVRVSDRYGRALDLTHDTSGRITSVSDGAMRTTFVYSGDLLSGATNSMSHITRYEYISPAPVAGLLRRIVRPEGNSPFTTDYDAQGRVASQTDALGNAWRFTYTGSTTQLELPNGSTWQYEYGPGARLLSLSTGSQLPVRIGYDAAGRRTSITDRLGATSRFSFDAATGRIDARTSADSTRTEIDWSRVGTDGFTVPSSVTWPGGATSELEYDALGRLASISDAIGGRWSWSYDASGSLDRATLPGGGIVDYTYDARGHMTERRMGDSLVRYGYDDYGRITSETRPGGRTTRYEYDILGRTTSLTRPSGARTRYEYDRNGNPTLVDDDGEIWRREYDDMDRPIALSGPMGTSLTLSYTALGSLARITGADGRAIEIGYDADGRRNALGDDEITLDAEGVALAMGRIAFGSDSRGRLTSLRDPFGAMHRFEYGANGLLARQSDDGGVAIDFDWSGYRLGRSSIDGAGIETGFEWSDNGSLTGLRDPLGARWSMGYDPFGASQSFGLPFGGEIDLVRPSSSRWELSLPDETTIAMGFRRRGRLEWIADDSDSLSFRYDDRGRFTGTDGVAISYDPLGAIAGFNGTSLVRGSHGAVTRVERDGGAIDYLYDDRHYLGGMTDEAGRAIRFEYDAEGRLTTMRRPNGTTLSYRFGDDGRLAQITDSAVHDIALEWRSDGRLAGATRTGTLAPVDMPEDLALRYTTASQIEGSEYDEMGRETVRNELEILWDGKRGLAESIDRGWERLDFEYDGLGNVTRRARGTEVEEREWGYGLFGLTLERIVTNTDTIAIYRAGGGVPVYMSSRRFGVRYFHFDEWGSTIALSDETGTVTDRYSYSPTGALLAREGTTPNPFRWRTVDGAMHEVGDLYRLDGRLYDSYTGRYLSPDLSGTSDPRSWNPYALTPGYRLPFALGTKLGSIGTGAPIDPRSLLLGTLLPFPLELIADGPAGPVIPPAQVVGSNRETGARPPASPGTSAGGTADNGVSSPASGVSNPGFGPGAIELATFNILVQRLQFARYLRDMQSRARTWSYDDDDDDDDDKSCEEELPFLDYVYTPNALLTHYLWYAGLDQWERFIYLLYVRAMINSTMPQPQPEQETPESILDEIEEVFVPA